ncbi:MAG: hypothetical protein AB3N14_18640, partial [Flavobacteriaceae bacterium]
MDILDTNDSIMSFVQMYLDTSNVLTCARLLKMIDTHAPFYELASFKKHLQQRIWHDGVEYVEAALS